MAHRWVLPKVAKWEVKHGGWDLATPDLLAPFLSTLPNFLDCRLESRNNKHGEEAEIHILNVAEKIGDGIDLWHGTTCHAVRSILAEGLRLAILSYPSVIPRGVVFCILNDPLKLAQ